MQARGRRPKASKGGNRGSERRYGRRAAARREARFAATIGFARAGSARLGDDPEQSRHCALQTLGSRESGTARLEEAVAAYQAALQEYTSFDP